MDVPPVLYHYTTAEGLLGILNEQAFWATDCEFLNDSSEMRYGLRLLDHTLREFAVQGEHSLALRGQVIKDGRGFRPGKKPFVVCFCKRGDLLSQWHGYAGGGGYAIGLAWTGIAASICNSNCALWQVEYDVDHQTEILTAHFEAAAIAAEEVMSECQSTEEEDIVLRFASHSILRSTAILASRYKDPVFRGEEEWRVVRFYPWNQQDDGLQFRVRGALVVPYLSIELRDPQTGLLPIAEVVLGPSVDDRLGRQSVQTLLKRRRCDAEVRWSQIPLRKG